MARLDLVRWGFYMYEVQDTVNMHEAKSHFSALVNTVMEGKEIRIAKAGKPVVKLVPLEEKKSKVQFGVLKGKWIPCATHYSEACWNCLLACPYSPRSI